MELLAKIFSPVSQYSIFHSSMFLMDIEYILLRIRKIHKHMYIHIHSNIYMDFHM